jgi:amidase
MSRDDSISKATTDAFRIPSGYNGLYGLRPSFGRLPYRGAANSMPGQNTVPSVAGPLTTSARSLKLMLKSTLSQKPWLRDPTVADLPWRDDRAILPSKLAFGVYRTDADQNQLAVRPLPPVKRGLEELVGLLRSLGHEVIEWEPPSHSRAMEIAVSPLPLIHLILH